MPGYKYETLDHELQFLREIESEIKNVSFNMNRLGIETIIITDNKRIAILIYQSLHQGSHFFINWFFIVCYYVEYIPIILIF